MKFRKKPVVIDAWPVRDLYRAACGNWGALPESVRNAYEIGGWVFTDEGIYVPTLEGSMLARMGDWLLRGVAGEFYPCKPDIFEATYEAVAELGKEGK